MRRLSLQKQVYLTYSSWLDVSRYLALRLLHLVVATGLSLFFVSTVAAQQQDLPASSTTGDAALEAKKFQQENQPYTIKWGDFKLLLTPSLGLDYNDNINVVKNHALDDFIIKPLLELKASYPIGRANLLTVDIGVGYDLYINHDNYSGPRLTSGSQVSFDTYVKDFRFDFHDQFQYSRDQAGVAAVAATGQLEYIQNTAGLTVDWDLRDVVLTVGYDHQNYISEASGNDYLNHSTEIVTGRAGLKVHPRITTGIEANIPFTSYDLPVLNDSVGYSGGVYAQWQPNSFISIAPKVGYTLYDFQQTSFFIRAKNQTSWYADLTVKHAITSAISYSFSAGHELRLGMQADSIDDWYFRPSLTWNLLRAVALNAGVTYEHGTQSAQGVLGAGGENYDHVGGNLGLAYSVTKHLVATLAYRYTVRSSNVIFREYTQNLIGLQLTYEPR